jgi:hypothetical protein
MFASRPQHNALPCLPKPGAELLQALVSRAASMLCLVTSLFGLLAWHWPGSQLCFLNYWTNLLCNDAAFAG